MCTSILDSFKWDGVLDLSLIRSAQQKQGKDPGREGEHCVGLALDGSLFYLTVSNGLESWTGFWWCAGLVLNGALLYLTASNGMESWTGFCWCAGFILGRGDAYGRGGASNGMESWTCMWWCVGLALDGALFI